MKTRRAASMVELLLILSACTVLLTLTGMLLQRSMRIQMQSRSRVDAERTALRFAEQFRRDVHQARKVVTDDAGRNESTFLQIDFADGRTAEYSQVKGSVQRLESGGAKPIWREVFNFPAFCSIAIEKQNDPQRVALTIASESNLQKPASDKPLMSTNVFPVYLHVVAVVGRDLRLNAAPAGEEATE